MITYVLLSGGLDSTACLDIALRSHQGVQCVFVDYGQAAADRELRAATLVSAHYEVPLSRHGLRGTGPFKEGEIAGRNLLLLSILTMMARPPALLTGGFHSGTAYYDCSPEFFAAVQALVDGYHDGKLRVSMPFLHWTKSAIREYASSSAVPVELTYSCQRSGPEPCGECMSCRDRNA